MTLEGWGIKTLDDVSKITRLAGAEYSDVWETNVNGEIIALRGFNIGNNEINLRDVERITQEMSLKLSRSKLNKDDIVFPCVGSIGKAYLVVEDNKFHINQNIAKLTPNISVDPLFLTYCLLSSASVNQILKFNTSSSQPNVLVGNLRKFRFSFPQSIKEQRKIAKILSTWDQGIATTEKLITTSKQQKKALMQQLLTGKKRLVNPETGRVFEGDWEEVPLGKVSSIYDGTHSTPKYVEQGVPFYSVEHLTKGDFSKTKFISEEVFDKENKRVKLERGDILMTRIGDIGTAKCLDWDVRASFYVSLALIKANHERFNSSYMGYYMNSHEFHSELHKRTIHVAFPKKINLGEINNCIVLLPPVFEQERIAKALSSTDQEIEHLESKLAHFQQEKKALMQQLLTGKRRVKVDSELEVV